MPQHDKAIGKVPFQSNSIRDGFLKGIIDRTIDEILASVSSLLGPGATDAFIIKENQTYYTRDGKEVMESLIFDNEVANYMHHVLYQAAYNQGVNIGDGSTTLLVLYCWIYKLLREHPDDYPDLVNTNINAVRSVWHQVVNDAVESIKTQVIQLDEDLLLSMLYTCTQDAELSAKIYDQLKDPILAGAYIVPRKSNIKTDFHVTVHNRPVYRVTNHFSIRPLQADSEYNVVYFCNGSIDIAHSELFAAMNMAAIPDPYKPDDPSAFVYPNILLVGTGVTEATRRSIREYNQFMKGVKLNTEQTCNVAILTLDDYRKMSIEEIEDLATVVSDYPGLGGMVQSLTFEAYLYNLFLTKDAREALHIDPIPELDDFDADQSVVSQMGLMFSRPYRVIYDEVEGIALDKELRGYSKDRYDKLRQEINDEKSPVRKLELNKRLRRSFGMFIDLEVGSVLLKDSQRKFELILDAIVSSAEAASDGVVIGSSTLHAAKRLYLLGRDAKDPAYKQVCNLLLQAISMTIDVLVTNYSGGDVNWNGMTAKYLLDTYGDLLRPMDFNLLNTTIWPAPVAAVPPEVIVTTVENEEGESHRYVIKPVVIETYNSIKAILENSTLPVELAMTKQVTLSGRAGLMGNYVD